MSAVSPRPSDRIRLMLRSVTLISGAGQIIDFVLPLSAADGLGLSATQTGMLLAAALGTAFLLRPLAGVWIDRRDRCTVAAASAVVLGLAYSLLAAADSFAVATLAASAGRAASTFLWIALRAMAAGRSSTEPRASSRMLRAEDLGSWAVLVPAVGLVSLLGCSSALVVAAVCSVGAAAILVSLRIHGSASAAESRPICELALLDIRTGRARRLVRDLRVPLLGVGLVGAGEAAISLLFLMHLQRDLHFSPLTIGATALPSIVALTVAQENMRVLTVRYGRRRMIGHAVATHVVCAIGLTVSHEPTMIAAVWALSAIGLAALLPIEQTIIAAAAGTRSVGRAFGVYEAVALLSAAVGTLAAGVLFDHGPWPVVCLACAGTTLGGGLVLTSCVPMARTVPNRPDA
ncbi:MFS transporter [Clavibacter sp. VKM Ac-2873]|uniref:MFS transporter n=1 Tax=Clavibacter sp. VKM Ac-2873 TaxID=2783813 RepID=UPI00188DC48F|nr:MFS transporter [Clavibacter sp. VKM Ac-2873]MBF4619461.1 MFS transporter [Clavibacter sp. VKM Ac-2873]